MSNLSIANRRSLVPAIIVRFLLLALVWVVLTEGDMGYWALAVVLIGVATLASLLLLPPGSWQLRAIGVARFLPFFLKQSVLSSVDVARRALQPGETLAPTFFTFQLRLPDGPAQVFAVNTFSLLPGTLSVALHAGQLRVHTLDRSMPVESTLRELETLVAGLFGVTLSEPD